MLKQCSLSVFLDLLLEKFATKLDEHPTLPLQLHHHVRIHPILIEIMPSTFMSTWGRKYQQFWWVFVQQFGNPITISFPTEVKTILEIKRQPCKPKLLGYWCKSRWTKHFGNKKFASLAVGSWQGYSLGHAAAVDGERPCTQEGIRLPVDGTKTQFGMSGCFWEWP